MLLDVGNHPPRFNTEGSDNGHSLFAGPLHQVAKNAAQTGPTETDGAPHAGSQRRRQVQPY